MSIVGIGTDIVLISRIVQLFEQYGTRFARRILGPQELTEFERRLSKIPAGKDRAVRYLAKRFAAKEAFSKAVGLGLRGPMTLLSVEILNNQKGQPYVVPRKAMAHYMTSRNWVAHVSISDEVETATAFVIVESPLSPVSPESTLTQNI